MPAASAPQALHITSRVWLKISNLKWIPGTVQSVGDRYSAIPPCVRIAISSNARPWRTAGYRAHPRHCSCTSFKPRRVLTGSAAALAAGS